MEANRTNGYATQAPSTPARQFAGHVLIDPDNADLDWMRRQLAEDDPTDRREKYHDFIGVSNSDLGTLDKHPLHFYNKKILGEEEDEDEKPSTAYLLGNMIECQLLLSGVFEEEFIREPEEMSTPSSSKQKEFCERVIGGESPEDAYRQCYSTKRKSEEKIEEKTAEKYESLEPYMNFTQQVEESGKTPYTAGQKEKVNAAILDAKTSTGYQWLDSQKGTHLVEYPMVGQMDVGPKTVLTKGLADWVIVGSREVISVDLKTTSKPLSDFDYFYHRYRYYRQQAYYRAMLRQQFPNKRVRTYCLATKTRTPFGTRLFQINESLLESGIEEAQSLLRRLVLHLSEDYDFQRPLEDQRSAKVALGAREDLIERHLSKSSLQ